jgi:hypothetical protein
MHQHTYDYTEDGGPVQVWTKTDDVLGQGAGPEFLVETAEFEGRSAVELTIGSVVLFDAEVSTLTDEDGSTVVAVGASEILLSPQEARWLANELLKAAGS